MAQFPTRTPSNQAIVNSMIASEAPSTLKQALYTVLSQKAWSLLDMKIEASEDASIEDMQEQGEQIKNDIASAFGYDCTVAISTFMDAYVSEIVESTIQAKILAGELMSGVPGGAGGNGDGTGNVGGAV